MQVTVHSVAGKMPRWVSDGVAEYEKRLPREIRLRFNDLPLARRGAADAFPVGAPAVCGWPGQTGDRRKT